MRITRSRTARWFATVVTLALSLTLLATTPASAGWGDNPPPGSSGGSGSAGGQSGAGEFACGQNIGLQPGALYKKMGRTWYRWWEYGYSSCVGKGASSQWNNTGYIELCSTGFLVWRFYGSASNPTAAVTRSRVNNTQWCAGETTSFPAHNPMDANVPVGSPWAAVQGVSLDQLYNGSPAYSYFRNDAGQLTTTGPARVQGGCEGLMSTTTIRQWYDKASENEKIALRAALGTDYWLVSSQGRGANATALSQAGLRNATGYPFSWAQWAATPQTKSQAPVPVAAHLADGYFLTSFQFEDRACASPFQFLNRSQVAPVNRTVVGTCYVPLLRKRTQLRNVRTGAYDWKWNTVQHDWNRLHWGDGERLSVYYRGSHYTPGGPGGDTLDAGVTGLDGPTQNHLIASWRNAMVNDYRNWWNQGVTTGTGAQIVPVNAYDGETNRAVIANSTPVDQNRAVQELWDSARCRVGTQITFDEPEPTSFPDVKASLNVEVATQEVLQVSPNTVQLKVSAPTAPLCDGKGCPDGVALESLSWDASVVGTNGYRLYQASSPSEEIPVGYDGLVYSTKAGFSKLRSQTFTIRFLHPTSAKQAVQLRLSRLSGTYSQTTLTDGLKIRGVSPITGAPYTVDTGALQAQKISPLRITATGAPLALQRGLPGNYYVDIPVVGAVQVPVK